MARLTSKETFGTSFHNTTIKTSVSKLREVLGNPQWDGNTGEDKVNFEWDCETNKGKLFTIYDWKEYRNID